MLPGEPFVSDTVGDGKRVVSNTFSPSNSSSLFPINGLPPLPDPILALNLVFGTKVTRVKVFVHKVKVIAILDTGSPVNVISSKLARCIKLAPDLDHCLIYGTASMASTKSLGAYLALPLRFGKLVLTAHAIVL